jgi:hypothetical protein
MVADGATVLVNQEVTADYLTGRRVYKTLSLLIAGSAGIPVPPFLLLLNENAEALTSFAGQWSTPLMLRVDYGRLPARKPIGGVAVHRIETMGRLCQFILAQGCYPLIHPDIDRFSDVYSCGVILTLKDLDAELEFVGEGFDAGDLRRGTSVPHEKMRLALPSRTLKEHSVIDQETYELERRRRARYSAALGQYTQELNRLGRARAAISVPRSGPLRAKDLERIPARYERVPSSILNSLIPLIETIKFRVLSTLPSSSVYVASFSYLPNRTWVLWDIYGQWYRR